MRPRRKYSKIHQYPSAYKYHEKVAGSLRHKNLKLEALFYVALLILTLITLALALLLRESPQF